MNRPEIHRELRPLRFIRPVLWPPLLPFLNAFLNISPHALGRGVKVRQHSITLKSGEAFSATVMEPPGLRRPAPCLVLYHGGAFVLEAAPHHYRLAKRLALSTACVVILPHYRLAPRHPYPVPAEDCYCAYEWVIANAALLGIDPGRIAVGGDSAGGNLAAAVCLMARDQKAPVPCFQMLLYPAVDRRMESGSLRACRNTPMWNAKLNRKMWKAYLPDVAFGPVHYASPLEAPSLAGLPDAYLETAELDPLKDEGVAYAQALRAAGVKVQSVQVEGAFHGYDLMENSSLVKECMRNRAAALKQAFFSDQE